MPMLGCNWHTPSAITAEHCIGRDEWLQHRVHRLRIQLFQLKVSLVVRPVSYHDCVRVTRSRFYEASFATLLLGGT